MTSDASEGGNSVSVDDKKKKLKKPETKTTSTVTTTSVSKASKDKKAMITTTRSNQQAREVRLCLQVTVSRKHQGEVDTWEVTLKKLQ